MGKIAIVTLITITALSGSCLICFKNTQTEPSVCASNTFCAIKVTEGVTEKYCQSDEVGCKTENNAEICICNTKGCNQNLSKAKASLVNSDINKNKSINLENSSENHRNSVQNLK